MLCYLYRLKSYVLESQLKCRVCIYFSCTKELFSLDQFILSRLPWRGDTKQFLYQTSNIDEIFIVYTTMKFSPRIPLKFIFFLQYYLASLIFHFLLFNYILNFVFIIALNLLFLGDTNRMIAEVWTEVMFHNTAQTKINVFYLRTFKFKLRLDVFFYSFAPSNVLKFVFFEENTEIYGFRK